MKPLAAEPTSFGRLLAQLRKERQLTLGAVARHLNLSVSYISDIEHDRRNPPAIAELAKLASLLKVEPTRLQAAAALTRPVEIRATNQRLYELATAFARRSGEFTQEDLEDLEAVLLRKGNE